MVFIRAKLAIPSTTTFEINGPGVSVLYHCDALHLKGWNLINLAHQKRTWLGGSDETSLLGLFGIYISMQNWQDPVSATFEINGHGASG